MKPNQDIRELIKKSPFKNYEVAQVLGYSSGSALSAKLQTELSEDEKQYFINKIKMMSRNHLDREFYEHSYNIQRAKIKPTYMSKVLRNINQLRTELDKAGTKEDFKKISELAIMISNMID